MKDKHVEFMGSILKKNFQLIKKNNNNGNSLPCFPYSRKKTFHIDQKTIQFCNVFLKRIVW